MVVCIGRPLEQGCSFRSARGNNSSYQNNYWAGSGSHLSGLGHASAPVSRHSRVSAMFVEGTSPTGRGSRLNPLLQRWPQSWTTHDCFEAYAKTQKNRRSRACPRETEAQQPKARAATKSEPELVEKSIPLSLCQEAGPSGRHWNSENCRLSDETNWHRQGSLSRSFFKTFAKDDDLSRTQINSEIS